MALSSRVTRPAVRSKRQSIAKSNRVRFLTLLLLAIKQKTAGGSELSVGLNTDSMLAVFVVGGNHSLVDR